MSITWPQDLIDDIARRKAVLVLGAGVSKNSTNINNLRPKDWKEFLETSCNSLSSKRIINQQIKNGDFLTACELIKKELGRDNFNSLIKNEFLTPKFKSADIHKFIYNLDSRIVITPNFDKIYDTYATTISEGSIIIKRFHEDDIIDCIRRSERLIIKIHGSVDSTDNLIFTRKDYSQARVKYKNFYNIIEALSLTHTFVFIGCGTNDPDIKLLLEDYTFKYPLNKKHHFIMPKNSLDKRVRDIITDTMSLNIIDYDSTNNHEKLTIGLEQLNKLVEIKRDEIAEKQNW